MTGFDKAELSRRMDGAINALEQEFTGLRTGRASISLLDHVTVDAYGAKMPLNQLATVNAPEPRLLTVQVWDQSMVAAVDKAIQNAGLGLNPMAEGQTIRVPVPDLSEERRQELVKVAHRYAEQARIAVRNVRRDGMDTLKKMEKDGDISKDQHHDLAEEVQKLTDQHVKNIDDALAAKEKDILQV